MWLYDFCFNFVIVDISLYQCIFYLFSKQIRKKRLIRDIRATFEQEEDIIIIDFQNSDAWKIQFKIVINFIFSKDAEEERVMHSTSDNITFTPDGDANDVIDELFESLRSSYQGNLETSMTGSDFN